MTKHLSHTALVLALTAFTAPPSFAQHAPGGRHDTPQDSVRHSHIIDNPEQQAYYPGGQRPLMDYLRHNTRYPESAMGSGKEGRIIVGFLVGEDGSLSDFKVEKVRGDLGPDFEAEALRVVKAMPEQKWAPHRIQGVAKAQRYMVPVMFFKDGKAPEPRQGFVPRDSTMRGHHGPRPDGMQRPPRDHRHKGGPRHPGKNHMDDAVVVVNGKVLEGELDIRPQDIERVDVVTDEQEIAKYTKEKGKKVVMITTKSK